MDEIQWFIANNQHQFGYIMHEASRQWIAKDPVGALTVGDCNIVVRRHGQYHELLEKIEMLEKQKTGIPWQKYDPENPPMEGTKYLVSDKNHTSFGWFEKEEDEMCWCTDDLGSVHSSSVTHYAPINLPREEETC